MTRAASGCELVERRTRHEPTSLISNSRARRGSVRFCGAMSLRRRPAPAFHRRRRAHPHRHEQARRTLRPHDHAGGSRRSRQARPPRRARVACGSTTPPPTRWCCGSRPASHRCAFRRGAGFIGACARERRILNVPDCYADDRFNPEVDRASGYRTRCMLTLPLVDHKDVLVGAMQVLNKIDGVFDANDESLATVLAAQCAVAIQRTRMTEAMIEGEKLRHELETARLVQMSTLPADDAGGRRLRLPRHVEAGRSDRRRYLRPRRHRPGRADRARRRDRSRHRAGPVGDSDAGHAAHGVPARARISRPRFSRSTTSSPRPWPTTASSRRSSGLLDTARHRVRFHSGGQAPILHFGREAGACTRSNPTSFPLAAMPLKSLRPARRPRPRAGRRAGAPFRRHLRIPQCRGRAVRRAAGRAGSSPSIAACRWLRSRPTC